MRMRVAARFANFRHRLPVSDRCCETIAFHLPSPDKLTLSTRKMHGITEKAALGSISEPAAGTVSANSRNWRVFLFLAIALAVCFSKPLYDLLRLSLKEEIYSHILLIPFISAYLFGQRRAL